MLIAALVAAAALLDGGQVRVIASTPTPAAVRAPDTAPGREGETRRLCRFERATGSNFQQRVCRDVPRAGFQDQQTREFMRGTQRVRLPDNGAAYVPQGPNG